MTSDAQSNKAVPEGQLFSHLYQKPEKPLPDSLAARKRLGGFIAEVHKERTLDLGKSLHLHVGNNRHMHSGFESNYFNVGRFFDEEPIGHVLSAITLFWRVLKNDYGSERSAEAWKRWVARVFQEEGVGYRVDSKCGIHPLNDGAFEMAVQSSIDALSAGEFSAVRAEFEASLNFLDPKTSNPKHAIISAFQALETLNCIVAGKSGAVLGPSDVEKTLTPCVIRSASNNFEVESIRQFMTGLKNLITAGQTYRHGKPTEDAHQPSPAYAFAYVNALAPFLRLIALAFRNQASSESK